MNDAMITYLADNLYESVEDWAADSDYEFRNGEWVDWDGNPVDVCAALAGAIEAMEMNR